MPLAIRIACLTLLGLSTVLAAAPPARVVLSEVTEREVSQSNRMVGIIDFDRIADVAPEVRGIISEHFIREGAQVRRDQILVQLNNDFTLQDIRITDLDIGQVDAELEKLGKNLKRYESLKQTDATSERAYEETYYDYQSQLKRKESLKQRIERLLLHIRKAQVRAPFDAVILKKYKEQGEWAAPESPVVKLGSIEDAIAKVAVSESLIQFIKTGELVDLRVPALDLKIQGKIRGFVPIANVRSKSVYLKVDLPYQTSMFQNMSVDVEVPVSHKKRLRLIKRDAVVRFKGKEFVYTVVEGKAKILPVNIVSRMGEWVAVDSPHIKAGMQVVIDGNARLRPDQAVNVVEK